MASLYLSDWSIEEVASRMGCTRETVRYHLLRMGTKLRGTGMRTARSRAKWSGQKHGNWKGGKQISSGGYVLLLRKDHPNSCDGYIAEHRLIIESHLKKTNPKHPALNKHGYLRSTWIVHHKNHDKTDNRIENLEPMRAKKHISMHNRNRPHYKHELRRLRGILDTHGLSY